MPSVFCLIYLRWEFIHLRYCCFKKNFSRENITCVVNDAVKILISLVWARSFVDLNNLNVLNGSYKKDISIVAIIPYQGDSDSFSFSMAGVQEDHRLHEQRMRNESKIQNDFCSLKKEENSLRVVSVICFFMISWPRKLNGENKATKVLTRKTCCVLMFFPLHPMTSQQTDVSVDISISQK